MQNFLKRYLIVLVKRFYKDIASCANSGDKQCDAEDTAHPGEGTETLESACVAEYFLLSELNRSYIVIIIVSLKGFPILSCFGVERLSHLSSSVISSKLHRRCCFIILQPVTHDVLFYR